MGFVADADELERAMGKIIIIIIITLLKFTIQFKYKYFFLQKAL